MAYNGMSDTDLAYTAGIMDGEGNIGIYANTSRKGNPVLSLKIRVSSTDEWLPQWLKEQFGGHVGVQLQPEDKNWKPAWYWTVSCRKAMAVLEVILPYLHLKKPQAELAIKFQQRHYRGHHIKGDELVLAEAEALLMRTLNKRGLH